MSDTIREKLSPVDLAFVIRQHLLGVAPEDQDIVLGDEDWETILEALALLPQSPEGMVMHCWFMEAPDGSNSAGPFDTKEQGEAWAKMSAVHAPHYAAWKAIPLYRAVSSHSQEQGKGDE